MILYAHRGKEFGHFIALFKMRDANLWIQFALMERDKLGGICCAGTKALVRSFELVIVGYAGD